MGDYDELARRPEHGKLPVEPGTTRCGPEAVKAALMGVTGATTVEEATRIAVGRPALGHEGKPLWSVPAFRKPSKTGCTRSRRSSTATNPKSCARR